MSNFEELVKMHARVIRQLRVTEFGGTLDLLVRDALTVAKGYGAGNERENAAAICDENARTWAVLRDGVAEAELNGIHHAHIESATSLARRIRSGERAAPVDGVADDRPQGPCICPKAQHTVGSWTASYRSLACPVHGDTPDPAAAVTADEGESGDGARCPECKEFARQFMDGAGVWRFDWHREGKFTCASSYQPYIAPVPFWNAESVKAFNEPTAPPVANEWRDPLANWPEVDKRVEGEWDETPGTQIVYRDYLNYWFAEGDKDSVPTRWQCPPPSRWRFIEPVSATDTVEADMTDNDKESYETRWMKACARHLQAACDLAVAKAERDKLQSQHARYDMILSGIPDSQNLDKITAERDRLAATCADYERTVTELRVELESAKANRDAIKVAARDLFRSVEKQQRTAYHTRNRFAHIGIIDDIPF